MRSLATVSPPGMEYDDFLFAPIGTDQNGMAVSVLSALARLGIEPRQEAASLASLPAENATRRLTALGTALSEESSMTLHPVPLMADLIGRLPGRSFAKMPMGSALKSMQLTPNLLAAIYLACVAIIVSAQFAAAGSQTPAQSVSVAAGTHAPRAPGAGTSSGR